MLAETSQGASILRRLAGLEPGWHAAIDCAWQLAGDDYEALAQQVEAAVRAL